MAEEQSTAQAQAEGAPMKGNVYGENQWVSMELTNRMRKDQMRIQNATLNYGKFYKGTKDREIPASDVNKIIIVPGSMDKVNACGRYLSPSGTDGHIDVYDEGTKICRLYWDCPYGKVDNKFEIRDYDPGTSDYSVTVSDWNPGPGPIGRVTIVISRIG